MQKHKKLRIYNTGSPDPAIQSGVCPTVLIPVANEGKTAILFDEKYFGWRYDGQDIGDETHSLKPRSPHYVEELCSVDNTLINHSEGYTENYHCIGHCPYGKVGDALLIDGVLVDITHVDLLEPEAASNMWQWALTVELITGEPDHD